MGENSSTYYSRNGQNDVVGLMDANGNCAVEYLYTEAVTLTSYCERYICRCG